MARFEAHDFQADLAGLQQLAAFCQRFSPRTAVEEADPPDSLLLDITGCAPLFGGESALAKAVLDELRYQNYEARVAIADTVGIAWAVAHYGVESRVVPPGGQTEALQPLAIEALRLPAEAVQSLREFDIHSISQLLELPRSTLPSRFGGEVLRRLDQALGRIPEFLEPEPPAEPIEASWPFDFPVTDRQTIEVVLQHLLEQVLEPLRARQHGVRQLLCWLQVAGHEPVQISVRLLEASDSAKHLFELVRLRCESTPIPAEVLAAAVRVIEAVPLAVHQGQLFDNGAGRDQQKQFALLVERLSGRLGERAVLQPMLRVDAQPELAWYTEPWLHHGLSARKSSCANSMPTLKRRPLCLKRPVVISAMSVVPDGPPVRFEWQGRSYRVTHCWGPERIETGWWRNADARRDYYLVETTTGERFWLFRALAAASWFLQGSFD